MEKKELIDRVAEQTGLTKKAAAAAVNSTFEVIAEAMKNDDKVRVIGFGTFEAQHRPARTGHNPRTKEIIEIPARTVPVCKMSSSVLK